MAEGGGSDGDGAAIDQSNFGAAPAIEDRRSDAAAAAAAAAAADREEEGLLMEDKKGQIQEDGRTTDSEAGNHEAGGGGGFSSVVVRNAANSDDEEAHRRRERGERFSDADCLHIFHLPEDVSSENLVTLLSETGAIKIGRAGDPMVKIFKSLKPGECEAEVILEDPKSAKAMITWFNGYEYNGNKIEVTLGRKRSRSPSPRGGGKRSEDTRRGVRMPYRGRGRPRYEPPFQPPAYGRGFGRPAFGPGRGRGFDDFRPGDSFGRNNPNVAPREGDWICPEPTCGNLNFARRSACNNCNRPRKELLDPGYRGPPPFLDHPPPVMDRGFGPPPVGLWDRVPFEDFGPPDHHHHQHFPDRHFHHPRDFRRDSFDRYDDRDRYEKPMPFDRGFDRGFYRERERERDYYAERGFRDERRPPSPFHHHHSRCFRDRSRSPVRRSAAAAPPAAPAAAAAADHRYKSDWPHHQQFDHHSGNSRERERRGESRRDSQRNGLRR